MYFSDDDFININCYSSFRNLLCNMLMMGPILKNIASQCQVLATNDRRATPENRKTMLIDLLITLSCSFCRVICIKVDIKRELYVFTCISIH